MALSEFDKYLGNRIFDILEAVEPPIPKQEIAELIGVKPSNLSEMLSGKRHFQIEMICKIADRVGCSVDYLLGRTEVRSQDISLQVACSALGLSQDAVQNLINLQSRTTKLPDGSAVNLTDTDMLSALLASPKFPDFLLELRFTQISVDKAAKTVSNASSVDDIDSLYKAKEDLRFHTFKVADETRYILDDLLNIEVLYKVFDITAGRIMQPSDHGQETEAEI